MKKKSVKPQDTRPPFLLELVLSNRCNLACDYCSSSFLLKDGTRKVLPFSTLRRAVELYAGCLEENGLAGEGLVSFTGNEPLLDFPLLRRVVRHIRRAYPRMRMRLDTNGTLLDAGKASFLSRNGVRIFVSLDGCRAAHDRHRTFPGGRGSFDVVVGALRALPEKLRSGGDLCVWSVVTPETIGLLPESLDFFRGLGVGTVVLGLETYARWDAAALRRLKTAFRLFRARPLEALGGCPPPRFLFGLSGSSDFRGMIGQAVSLALDGRFYPCDFALIPPGGQDLSVGDLESGIDLRKLDRMISSPMFRRIERGCERMSGLRAPVERYYRGLSLGLSGRELSRDLRDTSRVNLLFAREMSGYLGLLERGERLATAPGFGDLAHSPKYSADKTAAAFRLRAGGAPLSAQRAGLDLFLYAPGRTKSLTLGFPAGDAPARGSAADLCAYSLAKAGLLGLKLAVSLEPE